MQLDENGNPSATPNPIDQAVLAATEAGDGFALGLLETVDPDNKGARNVLITVGKPLALHEERQLRALPRDHKLKDATSLVNYAEKYAPKDKAIVFVADDAIRLVIADDLEKGTREIVTVAFELSAEWKAWSALINGNPLTHRQLLDFLLMWKHTLDKPEILDSMRSVSVRAEFKQDSDLQDEGDTVGVFYKATAGDNLVRFPKEFSLVLPVFDEDAEDEGLWPTVEVTLVVQLPREHTDEVKFLLRSSDWIKSRRERIFKEVEALRADMSEYLILRGTPAYKTDDRLVVLKGESAAR